MNRISTVVITLNEGKNIRRCLDSVKDFSYEIVVVDSGSTDKTVEIAKSFGAKVYTRKFDDFGSQKEYGVGKAVGEWIFSLDADEEVTDELAQELVVVSGDDDYDGYLVPRRNVILGKEIKHTRWSPDEHVWFYRKGKGKWGKGVHAEVVVDGKVGKLKGAKMHYQHETVADFVDMINSYTEGEANEKVSRGERFSYFKLFYYPLLSFFRRFFYKKGFLDGWRGFVLSYLMAIYRMTTWVKVWEKRA